MSRGMRRLAWILATVVVAIAAVVLIVFALLPRDSLKTQIAEQIAAWTGRDVSVAGDPKISIFPALTVTLDDVRVDGPDGMADAQILSMDRLKGTIRLLPLLIGQVEVGSFTMIRPVIHLVRDERGNRNWAFNSGAAALQLAFSGDVPLGAFRLEDGSLSYENRETGDKEQLDSVNLSLDWPSVRKPMAIEGSGIWRGEQVTFNGGADRPFAYVSGSETPMHCRVEAAPISISVTGTAADYPRLHISGGLELTSPSLRRFLSWLGRSVGPGSSLGEASLSGTADLSDNVLSMENAQFTLDGNAASGALKVIGGSKPDFAGTLAFGALDLSPYFAGLSNAVALGPDWHGVALPTGWLANANADIRLSADSVKIGALDAGSTAASVSLRDGRLEVGLARAAFERGSISGNLAITDSAGGPVADATAQLRATDVELSELSPAFRMPPGVSGAASLVVDLASKGETLGALLDTLGGNAKLQLQSAAVPLFGAADVAAGNAAPASTGMMPVRVRSAAASLTIADGVALVDRAEAVTDTYAVTATGSVKFADGALDLQGTVTPGEPGAALGAPIPFAVDGTLANPLARRQALAN